MVHKKVILFLHLISLFSLSTFAETTVRGAKTNENAIMSHEQYHQGAFVGTLFGFGIGHAIQNRYTNKGWIFTMLEGSSVSCFIVAEIIKQTSPSGTPRSPNLPAMIAVTLWYLGGAVSLVGFKIWESIDLWATPPSRDMIEERSLKGKLSISPILSPSFVGFSLLF